jgi:hypothetical protein
MPSIKKLISEVKDPNDYDSVLFVSLKDGQIANIGFTGLRPSGIDQASLMYRITMEAGNAIAFDAISKSRGTSEKESNPS